MKQQKIGTWLLLIGSGIAVTCLLLTAIYVIKTMNSVNHEKTSNRTTTVTILTTDVIADQSWGSLAYNGMINIQQNFEVDTEIKSELSDEQSIENAAIDAAENGSDIIIGHGREFSTIFNQVASNYKDTFFVTIHGDSKHENQAVYTYDQGEMEYFAGIAATLVTKSNKIALIDAYEAREKNPQFERAIKEYAPEAEFSYVVVDSRDDGEKALTLMNELLEEGYDVFYSKGNGFNREVIKRAIETDTFVIGYLDDQSYMGKSNVITSVMNDVPSAYLAIMKDYFSDTGIKAGKKILTEDDGVYRLAELGPMLTEKDKQFIAKEKETFSQ
ncbi:BMP family ABC transporter substrate-binding protein [Mangrovibacillus cuniculi]|uniref:BMP family ABC transporter substrate-binding protein n=1 Tax=Mangrovibacillus cuniculi TaxID=2593652 RepID=A0A7S8HEH1_9BACI|nr:BMP family ABC transporter substrate-binding protein [Mangrovibacillus cuniculi]QPC45712.1 BMP family ABC transporter substrate-binding protein [Mangrovibacillus cuniculi]